VSVLALTKLQQDAFMDVANEETKEAWINDMITKSPTFQYWNTILNMNMLAVMFVFSNWNQTAMDGVRL
jgi:hypothetical protein